MSNEPVFVQQHPSKLKFGDLRVWHIPQIPMQGFYVYVKKLEQAKLIIDTLAEYDLFQLKHNVKPDYSNASGLQVYSPRDPRYPDVPVPGVWEEWESAHGENIDEWEPE